MFAHGRINCFRTAAATVLVYVCAQEGRRGVVMSERGKGGGVGKKIKGGKKKKIDKQTMYRSCHVYEWFRPEWMNVTYVR